MIDVGIDRSRERRAPVVGFRSRILSPIAMAMAMAMGLVAWSGVDKAFADRPGESFPLPPAGFKPRHGITARVDASWVDANGYRPVRITIRTVGGVPSPADRSFDVVLRANVLYNTTVTPQATKTIDLMQGDSTAEGTILIPQSSAWTSLEVEMYEGGRGLREMEFVSSIASPNPMLWSESLPALLFIDADAPSIEERQAKFGVGGGVLLGWNGGPTIPGVAMSTDIADSPVGATANGEDGTGGDESKAGDKPEPEPTLPDIRSFVHLFMLQDVNGAYNSPDLSSNLSSKKPVSDAETLRRIATLPKVELLPPSELPDQWLGLTCFDLVFISLADLKTMKQTTPDELAALVDWNASGPTLVVYGAGEDFGRLDEVEKTLGIGPVRSESDAANRGWTSPDPQLSSKAMSVPQVYNPNGGYWQWINGQQVWKSNTQSASSNYATGADTIFDRSPWKGENPPFVIRDHGFGRIVAWGDESPFPGRIHDWTWMFHTIGDSKWRWVQRHGLSLNRANGNFWDWVIPGVGMPPVISFLVLITLFVVVIGPVNYLTLSRMKRLYMLLVTVPAGAGLVTACLLLFALFTDGIGVRARIRSVTRLDQRVNRATVISRQTYYAGIAPSRGLQFPDEAAVYPIELHPARVSKGEMSQRQINWDREQWMRRGFLRSRTQHQFLVIERQESDLGLEFPSASTSNGALQVKNGLGAAVKCLIVADRNGKLYMAEDLAADETSDLTSIAAEDASRHFRNYTSEQSLAIPPEYQRAYRAVGNNYNYGFGYNYYANQRESIDNGQPQPFPSTSDLENGFRAGGLATPPRIPPRSYVAFLVSAPHVSLGVQRSRQEECLHMVLGEY